MSDPHRRLSNVGTAVTVSNMLQEFGLVYNILNIGNYHCGTWEAKARGLRVQAFPGLDNKINSKTLGFFGGEGV